MNYNVGEPGGPSGPFWSIVREDGMVFALQIPSEKIARRIAGALESADSGCARCEALEAVLRDVRTRAERAEGNLPSAPDNDGDDWHLIEIDLQHIWASASAVLALSTPTGASRPTGGAV